MSTRSVSQEPPSISICELYLDKLFDLLSTDDDPTGGKPPASPRPRKQRYYRRELKVEKTRRLIVPNRSRANAVSIIDSDCLRRLLAEADKRRQTSVTSVNKVSSRSHMFVTLEVPATSSSSASSTGSITFVDLAGQERADANGDSAEPKSIN
jgi:hypothetical protein